MNDVNDNGDSSDSENEHEDEVQSSDDELSFESDDEGNYQQNLNKKHLPIASDDEDDDNALEEQEDEEEEEELGDEEESDDDENVYESDGSDELSFEDDSDLDETEEKPSTSNSIQKKSLKQNGASKANGDVRKAVDKTKEPGSLLRVKKTDQNAVEAFKNELNHSDGGSALIDKTEEDEYEKHDTDDEEDIRNTVGNIPMHWYDEYKHIGYDWEAKKIIKPAKRDQLDDFLKRMEDPNFWRTVKDPKTGQDVILSDADIDLIKRINSRRIPDANIDDYTVCISL